MQIPQIKTLLSITELLNHLGIPTKKTTAKSYSIRCPFHEEKNKLKKNMSVYPGDNTVYCFSTKCRTAGHSQDVIGVVKQYYNLNDHEAILKSKQIIYELGKWPVDLPVPNHSMKTAEKKEDKAEPATEKPGTQKLLPAAVSKSPSFGGVGEVTLYQLHQDKYGSYHFTTRLLQLQSIGGIGNPGLHTLHITLGVKKNPHQLAVETLRHHLDLYHEGALQGMIKKIAERFSLGMQPITQDMALFIEALESEKLRLYDEKQNRHPTKKERKVLTPEEQSEAIKNLSNLNLLPWLYETLPQTGIVGEQKNAMMVLTAMVSSQLHTPISVMCLSQSGAGKSYTVHKCAACIPKEWQRKGTSFTEQSFYHFLEDELSHTVFIIEDTTGLKGVEYVTRELMSGEEVVKFMPEKDSRSGKINTIPITVKGPISFIGTTTKDKQYEDNSNRMIEIYLDGSAEQDQRISQYQKKVKAGLIDKNKEKQLQQQLQHMFLSLTIPHRIQNPYAMLIDMPEKYFVKRRGLPLLLNFIDGLSFINQYNPDAEKLPSPPGGEGAGGEVLLTHPSEIEWGFTLLRESLFRKCDELTAKLRDFLDKVKQWLKEKEQQSFYGNELRKHLRLEPRQVQRYIKTLVSYGYIKISGSIKNKKEYVIDDYMSSEGLYKEIDQHIKTIMQKVWAMHEQRKADKSKQRAA
jgi:DNA-binding MarR family transcriptional regulator